MKNFNCQENEKLKFQEAYCSLEKENDHLNNNLLNFSQSMDDLKGHNLMIDQEYDSLQRDNEQLIKEIEFLKNQLENLSNDFNAIKVENSEINQKLKKNEIKFDNLVKENKIRLNLKIEIINEQKMELEEFKEASMKAENLVRLKDQEEKKRNELTFNRQINLIFQNIEYLSIKMTLEFLLKFYNNGYVFIISTQSRGNYKC